MPEAMSARNTGERTMHKQTHRLMITVCKASEERSVVDTEKWGSLNR